MERTVYEVRLSVVVKDEIFQENNRNIPYEAPDVLSDIISSIKSIDCFYPNVYMNVGLFIYEDSISPESDAMITSYMRAMNGSFVKGLMSIESHVIYNPVI